MLPRGASGKDGEGSSEPIESCVDDMRLGISGMNGDCGTGSGV